MNLVRPTSLSFEEIRADLEEYIRTSPEFSDVVDLFEHTVGALLLDLLAGVGAFLSHKALTARRESYLHTALTSRSVYMLGTMLGYSPRRKRLPVVQITFVPSTTADLYRGEAFGTIGAYQLLAFYDFHMTQGTETTQKFVVGAYETYSFTVQETVSWLSVVTPPSSIYGPFAVSDQLTLEGNPLVELILEPDVPVSLTDQLEELGTYEVVVTTHHEGGIRITFGDGITGRKPFAGESYTVRYFSGPGYVADLPSLEVSSPYIESLTSFEVLDRGADEDPLDAVRTLAPRYYSTLKRAVTASDYRSIAMSYPGIKDAYAEKDAIAHVNIYYLTDSGEVWGERDGPPLPERFGIEALGHPSYIPALLTLAG